MSIVSGSPPAAPASMGGLSSAVEDLSVLPEMNSLRFDGSSYLSKAFGSGSRTTATFSFWVKILRNSDAAIFSTGAYSTDLFELLFYNDNFFIQNTPNSATRNLHLVSTSVYRDTSAWYHFIIAIDTTATNGKCDIYVNGVLLNDFSTNTLSTTVLNLGNNTNYYIGSRADGNYKFNGYMANIQFIDGQALDHNSFGEWISDIWRPRPYTGDYGVNGFHLDFAGENMVYDSNGKLTQVLDASSNDNHWTAH